MPSVRTKVNPSTKRASSRLTVAVCMRGLGQIAGGHHCMKDFNMTQADGGHRGSAVRAMSFLHECNKNDIFIAYALWRNRKNRIMHAAPEFLMPHSLYADTDLSAENLLRLPAEFGCPVWA